MSRINSAWLKWARGVEHQQILARATRELQQSGAWNRFDRCDNASAEQDQLLRVHWHLAEAEPIPERWGVLLGDVFTNFRAALDHTIWAAVIQHSGPPERAERVQFPITREARQMNNPRRDLRQLVAPAVWEIVEEVQPCNLADPQRHPLETLRWASNVDKHRFLHPAARAFVDAGPVIVRPGAHELEILDEWRAPGQVEVGEVVAGVILRRSTESQGVDLGLTVAHTFVLQVGDNPESWAALAEVMEAIQDAVLAVVIRVANALGMEAPDPDSLELGLEHSAVAPEFGGRVIRWE